ncbi:MAG: hypothetical protein GY754_07545 [bacterium]|nr:hypothetical protein [bacterium]
MPVYKYKSFEEAEKALWNFNPDEDYYKNASELWDMANKLSPVKCRRGIFKFRTIEEANKHRMEWELENAIQLRKERDSLKS